MPPDLIDYLNWKSLFNSAIGSTICLGIDARNVLRYFRIRWFLSVIVFIFSAMTKFISAHMDFDNQVQTNSCNYNYIILILVSLNWPWADPRTLDLARWRTGLPRYGLGFDLMTLWIQHRRRTWGKPGLYLYLTSWRSSSMLSGIRYHPWNDTDPQLFV